MFGSNFTANFGIPEFPFQGTDAQGGLFAPNAPGQDMSQNAAPGPAAPMGGITPAIGQPTAPQSATPAAPSPLAGGPLSPGGAAPQQPAAPDGGMMTPPPAAGIGSPFGKPQV
jgi:hypothetical protein